MAGRRLRASSRLAGSVLVASAGVLALGMGAPPVSADDLAPFPADGVEGAAESDQPAPTIAVEPSTDLAWGRTITVSGSGFTPGSSIVVTMCHDPIVDRSSCDFSTKRLGRSDSAGNFSLAYEVADTVLGRSCVPAGCLIGTANLDAPDEIASPVGLGFAVPPETVPAAGPAAVGVPDGNVAAPREQVSGTGVAAQAAPTISVSPSTGLTSGQTVTITGSGFTPGSSIGVSLCDDPFVDGSSCDFSTAKIGSSDGTGGFTLSYQVVDTIHGHSCVPTGCLLGAANLNVEGEFANLVSLSFGAGSTSTTVGTPAAPGPATSGAAGASHAAGAPSTAALANTGQSDSLPLVALAGFALMTVGAALTAAARRVRAVASA